MEHPLLGTLTWWHLLLLTVAAGVVAFGMDAWHRWRQKREE